MVLAVCALGVSITSAATTSSKPAAANPAAAQAVASEPIASLELTAADEPGVAAVLSGRDCRQQLIVTGRTASGRLLDLTDKVAFSSRPTGIVEIDASGLVRPLTDGQVTIEARHQRGLMARARVDVRNCRSDLAVNFPNEVVPVFTKFGCNSGGCHGKSGGQNGFRLSLLGFEPTEDFEHLVKEGRGRRLFPGSPDESLLLKKAVNAVPHGGGQRLARDAHEYRLLRRWIAQ
ncbi:MAG TPA: S-layer protein, partial [Pirellulales bacterium]